MLPVPSLFGLWSRGSNVYLGLQGAYLWMTWIGRLFDQLAVTKGNPLAA
jgi:hypothetical protein